MTIYNKETRAPVRVLMYLVVRLDLELPRMRSQQTLHLLSEQSTGTRRSLRVPSCYSWHPRWADYC